MKKASETRRRIDNSIPTGGNIKLLNGRFSLGRHPWSSFFRNKNTSYYEEIQIKGDVLIMRLLNIFKKNVTKRDNRQYYKADMKTRDGSPYKTGVKANSLYEAAGIIALHMPEGNSIINVEKGML